MKFKNKEIKNYNKRKLQITFLSFMKNCCFKDE